MHASKKVTPYLHGKDTPIYRSRYHCWPSASGVVPRFSRDRARTAHYNEKKELL
jgi:hypothetical protein